MIKGRTPEEIRSAFNIESDFTPPVTGVSQERNRSVVCSRIPPKSGM